MRQMYLCDEVRVRHEELLKYVDKSKNGPQLVLKSQFRRFGNRRGLPALSAVAVGLRVNTGGAWLRVL